MSNQGDPFVAAQRIGSEIWSLAKSTLLVHMRYLDAALFRLELKPESIPTMQTDGRVLLYNLKWILNQYKRDKNFVTHAYLHSLLHCIYRHMFIGLTFQLELWDLACDIAVENFIHDLALPCLHTAMDSKRAAALEHLKQRIKPFTAEKLYHALRQDPAIYTKLADWEELFRVDDHILWYLPPDGIRRNGTASAMTSAEADALWQEVSHRVQVNIETFSQQQGSQMGSMIQELQAVNRERYDYTEFLRRFAVLGEVMQVNDDEFDYIFYTYGLKLYENLPLIEPLEYKEVKRIKEFVIAIDTSGSTSGKLVQKFLNKTYNILKQQENFFTKINLHIIQCDAGIQEDAKITCQEDFDEYLKTLEIRGSGGTDFRPVFSYVEELRQKKEFTNLKGLIYFTDGWGDFPAQQPDYDTAFVFIDSDYNNYNVPVWAIKLILQPEEI